MILYSNTPKIQMSQTPGALRLISLYSFILISLAGYGCSNNMVTPPETETSDIPAELWELNNQGLGYMEQFVNKIDGKEGYDKAAEYFKTITQRWPQWTPGKFNLAIALINTQRPENLEKAEELLRDALIDENQNPKYQYTLGFLLQYLGRINEALPYFESVCLRLKPDDAHSWVRFGDCIGNGTGPNGLTALDCYEKAVKLDPYMTTAMHKLQLATRLQGDAQRANTIMDEMRELTDSLNQSPFASEYLWSGPLTEAIGAPLYPPRDSAERLPEFNPISETKFNLPDQARWSTPDDRSAFHGGILNRVQARFGIRITSFDYDLDRDLDLLILNAVIENKTLRHVLLRNDGNATFTDVTNNAGLSTYRGHLGCAIGDFDNDGLEDLYLTGAGSNTLLRNQGSGTFEDVTEQAQIGLSEQVSMGALFLDLDHDSDLDLVVANYGPLTDINKMFVTEPYDGGSPNAFYSNIGEARLDTEENRDYPPLDVRFDKIQQEPWTELLPTVTFAAADFDNDRDLDLVELSDNAPVRLLINQRLLRWNALPLDTDLAPKQTYNGALVADWNNDVGIDLLLISNEHSPIFLKNDRSGNIDALPDFSLQASDMPALKFTQAVDADSDGWIDFLGLAANNNHIVLGSNQKRGILARPEWLQSLFQENSPIEGLISIPLADQDWPYLVAVQDGLPPLILKTEGNNSHWIRIILSGKPLRVPSPNKKTLRSNAGAIGARLMAHVGPSVITWENTTTNTGLCQSRVPITVGVGHASKADTLRLRWPDGIEQAELNVPAGEQVIIDETQRRGDSCPLIFTWNGSRFEYITDLLGGGGLGYLIEPGLYSNPDLDEDIKIEAQQLVPDDQNRLLIKIAEPMDELTYLDAAFLEVIDHPNSLSVYPDERFNPERPHHSDKRFIYQRRIFPVNATDHRGNKVLQDILDWDRNTVDHFARSMMWIGYAEEHFVELDFGHQFSGMDPNNPIALMLAGWIEYPYSQTNWAATTAGAELRTPILEWRNEEGQWETLESNLGYPAGLPRMMTLELTGRLAETITQLDSPSALKLRIRSNMEIYWDQIFIAHLEPEDQVKQTTLKPVQAQLSYRGYLQEYSPDGKAPTVFDNDQIISVPLLRLEGQTTPYGNVLPLADSPDNRFVLINAGDEILLVYDGNLLPNLPENWTRSYILRSYGYCKAIDLFNPNSHLVEPIPHSDTPDGNAKHDQP